MASPRDRGDSSCLDILSFLFGGGRNVMIVLFISIIHTRVILVPTSQALQVRRLQNEKSCRILYCKRQTRAKSGNEATRIVMFFTLSSVHAS